jgi:hypothetical protein
MRCVQNTKQGNLGKTIKVFYLLQSNDNLRRKGRRGRDGIDDFLDSKAMLSMTKIKSESSSSISE